MRKLPWSVVLVGAVALGIPTFATVFATDVAQWAGPAKWSLAGGWIIAALFVVVRNARRDHVLDEVTRGAARQRARRRANALEHSLRGILTWDPEFPVGWDWTVYLFDRKRDVLRPIYPVPEDEEESSLKEFELGKGAAGQAYGRRVTIVRLGDDVHNGRNGLTEDQQRYFQGRNAVVATPIYAHDDLVGVLSGICDDEDPYFLQGKNTTHLEALATSIGTLLLALEGASDGD